MGEYTYSDNRTSCIGSKLIVSFPLAETVFDTDNHLFSPKNVTPWNVQKKIKNGKPNIGLIILRIKSLPLFSISEIWTVHIMKKFWTSGPGREVR